MINKVLLNILKSFSGLIYHIQRLCIVVLKLSSGWDEWFKFQLILILKMWLVWSLLQVCIPAMFKLITVCLYMFHKYEPYTINNKKERRLSHKTENFYKITKFSFRCWSFILYSINEVHNKPVCPIQQTYSFQKITVI